MAGEMFGTPNGFQAYQEGQHTEALTRAANANASATEFATKQKQDMMKIMQGDKQVQQGEQAVDKMEEMSNRLVSAGMVEEGGKIALQASQIRAHTQTAAHQVELQKVQKLAQTEKLLESLSSSLGTVDTNSPDARDQFERAKMVWMDEHPEIQIPPGLSQYNKGAIEMLQRGTKTGLERLREQRMQRQYELNVVKADDSQKAKEKMESFREKELTSREDGRKFLANQANERARLSREAAERRQKSIGKSPVIGMPSKELLSVTSDLIGKNYPGMSKSDSDQASFAIASDAKVRMAANRGLGPNEAMQQAYDSAEANGDFAKEEGKKLFGYEYQSGKSSYKQMGRPIALPNNAKAADLKPMQVYSTPKGPLRWDGKQFVKVPSKQAPASTSSSGDDFGNDDGAP